MVHTLIQIYEVTSPDEASALAAMGVDHIGVLVGKGKFPREQSYSAARRILAAVPIFAKKLSLSLTDNIEEVAEVVAATEPDIVHLGTRPDALIASEVAKLKSRFPGIKIMRTIPVKGEDDISVAKTYIGIADFLLLDTWRLGDPEIGATGIVHDWNLSRKIVAQVAIKTILAGGIGPENAAEAVRLVQPAGVDSKTRTDLADGSGKDLSKVRALVEAVRRI